MQKAEKTGRSPFVKALIAGAVAGTCVDLSLFPLDTLKTRLQSSQGFVRAGGFRGIYAGVGSAVVGSAPGAALFFVSYEWMKTVLHRAEPLSLGEENVQGGGQGWREPLEHMAAASVGEIAACAVRVPTEVVKQRAQALQGKGSMEVLKDILRRRKQFGIAGVWSEMYRGWGITVMREVPFTIIQFPIWEALKRKRRQATGQSKVSAIESGMFGSIAGAIAAGLTTPLDVLKTRLMLAEEKQSAYKLAQSIFKQHGIKAFFGGIGPRILWISGGGAIFLGSYEWAYNKLH